MIPGTIRAEQLRVTITDHDSACPPWRNDLEFYGTENELLNFILDDANESGVRYSYTALKSDWMPPHCFWWRVWRVPL